MSDGPFPVFFRIEGTEEKRNRYFLTWRLSIVPSTLPPDEPSFSRFFALYPMTPRGSTTRWQDLAASMELDKAGSYGEDRIH
jgi:hypothetical protein